MGTVVGGQLSNLVGTDSWSVPVDVRVAGKRIIKSENTKAEISFTSNNEARRVLGSRDTYVLALAYVHGAMKVEGDIYSVINIKEQFYPDKLTVFDKARIVTNVLKSYKWHTQDNDADFISHHYDVANDFYRLFLGPSMMYSCALFSESSDDLDMAQERKIDYLLTKLCLQKGERLLDIGCGWGSLVIRAAQDFGAESLGVTLSEPQCAYANERIKELGLEDKCRVELMDYRNVDSSEKYDKIVSVGMYEHVGGRNLDAYFKKMHDLLRDDGLFVNHGITRKPKPDWKKASEARFLGQYIFPGGELHASQRVVEGMEAADFEVYDLESLRKHYVKTLRHWVRNLQTQPAEALSIVSEATYRAWLLYMAGCALAFEEGYLNLHQVCGSKTNAYGGREVPLTRAHLFDILAEE